MRKRASVLNFSDNIMPQLANEAELQSLTTEQQNLASQALDTKSALEIATIINDED